MLEYFYTNSEVASENPAHTNLGSKAVEITVELSETPQIGIEELESERKKIASENLRKLQQRFGERFVKGEHMEGGGYTGGAARELFARFMDRPGFADELKRLIPRKRGALLLLRENQDYLQSTLEQFYRLTMNYKDEPAKDPYKLARTVGYELTGPFETTSEFVQYNTDSRSKERLCTFNNPVERLNKYHVLWLRHEEVHDTLPADELTQENLSNAWKSYLKVIGRYDTSTGKYNLADLHPNREDPYGISSMSVQISRSGSQVSIKNRYNHTVVNPDNTLGSNLDNVTYGLRRAVYTRVGREDLMEEPDVGVAINYVTDNAGGIHYYWYEENNIYYGSYEYIEDGVVTTIDVSKYMMLSPQIYISIGQKGGDINLRPNVPSGKEIQLTADQSFFDAAVKLERGNCDEHTEEDLVYYNAFCEKNPYAVELRSQYAERYYAEMLLSVQESLIQQGNVSYEAYQNMSERLNLSHSISREDFTQLLGIKIAGWLENGTIDYLAARLVSNKSQPILVATPSALVDSDRIEKLLSTFGSNIRDKRDIDFLKQYTPEELSGKIVEELVTFSLFGSAFSLHGNIQDVREQLLSMQEDQPNVHVRVPSVLEAFSYIQTLMANGIKTSYSNTSTTMFDLPARKGSSASLEVPYIYSTNLITNLTSKDVNHFTINRLVVA